MDKKLNMDTSIFSLSTAESKFNSDRAYTEYLVSKKDAKKQIKSMNKRLSKRKYMHREIYKRLTQGCYNCAYREKKDNVDPPCDNCKYLNPMFKLNNHSAAW